MIHAPDVVFQAISKSTTHYKIIHIFLEISLFINDFEKLSINQGPSQYKYSISWDEISIIKIRWSWDSLIFIMGIHMLERQHLYIDMGPKCHFLAATKQLYKWYFPSVCPSVCPSVRLSVCPSHLFSCDQAALQMVFSVCPSVRPSVRPSVCHTFLTMFPSSYHHEIFRSYYQWPK